MRNKRIIIGDWTITSAVNMIERGGRQITLAPRLIDLLVYLAGRPGEVVSRDTLVESVWDRSIVTDQVVTQSIFELRKHLRDGRPAKSAPEYIQTIPKRGYRLVAEVREAPPVTPQPKPFVGPLPFANAEAAAQPAAPASSEIDDRQADLFGLAADTAEPVRTEPKLAVSDVQAGRPEPSNEPSGESVSEPVRESVSAESAASHEVPEPARETVRQEAQSADTLRTEKTAVTEVRAEDKTSDNASDEKDDAKKEGFGSFVAEIAKKFWLNETELGFKKTRY